MVVVAGITYPLPILRTSLTVTHADRLPTFIKSASKTCLSSLIHLSHISAPVTTMACAAQSGATVAAVADDYSKDRLKGSMQALISVSNKQDLRMLAKGLSDLGYTLVSTGGTALALEKDGFEVTKVETLTSFPEMLDGRVKTLHPAVHGGILANRDLESHMEALKVHGIGTFDVVIVNLYPFYDTVTRSDGASFVEAVEKIDIGGPAMIRAAAKNHRHVLVVIDPSDYSTLLSHLQGNGGNGEAFRRNLAWKAFQHVASYDSAVAEWFWKESNNENPAPMLTIPLTLKSPLRYGENPHQKAGFYVDKSLCEVGAGGIASSTQHHGKEMSYNNYLDADAAWNFVCELKNKACVVVKHSNPCGVSSSDDMLEAYRRAVLGDPISAFGGIVAFNSEVDEALAHEIREFSPDGKNKMFYEIVIAPSYTEKGLVVLKGKSKALRILEAKKVNRGRRSLRQVAGGWLLQDGDDLTPDDIEFKVVTEKAPNDSEMEDAKYAWGCVKHIKSNAISIAKGSTLLGMGSGQPNRRQSLDIAIKNAGKDVNGAALASDAFFPFAWGDAVEEACKAGVAVIVQPGGSIRDQDAIDCCNKYGVAMLFTGIRHFRH